MVKPYVIEIDMHCKKRIVVYAEDMADAKAKTEALVINDEAVAISVNDADSLRLECQGEAQSEDISKYRLYSEHGELYTPPPRQHRGALTREGKTVDCRLRKMRI